MSNKDRERMREEDRKRAKALWVGQFMAIGATKEEAELDFERHHPLTNTDNIEEKEQVYQCGRCGMPVPQGNRCPKCGAFVQSYM